MSRGARKHKIWITLTDEAYQHILVKQKRASATSPSRVTPSVIINQLIVDDLRKSESPPSRHRQAAAGAAAAEASGEARRGEIQ